MRRSKIIFSSILATVLGMGVLTAVTYNQTSQKPAVEKVEAASSAPAATGGYKYIYFTDNYSWGGTINVYFTTTSKTNDPSWPGNPMIGLYKNDDQPSGHIVYYSVVPDDTNMIIFNSNGSKQTIDITGFSLDNTNAWYITGSDSGKRTVRTWTYGGVGTGLLSGEKIYVYVQGGDATVTQDCAFATYFFNKPSGWGSASEEYWSAKGTAVADSNATFNLGTDKSSNNISLYEITVPGTNRQFNYMIPTRYNPSMTPSTNQWSGVYNQIYDDLPLAEYTFKTVRLDYYYTDGSNKMTYTATNDYYESKVYANIFGYHVMNNTKNICKADGTSTNVSALATAWTSLRSEYNGYSENIQYSIWEATASESGDTYLEKGTARYDYIAIHKYPSLIGNNTDFANRKTSPGKAYGAISNLSFLQIIGAKDNGLTITIIIVSSVTALSVGGYFFLRRKKEK